MPHILKYSDNPIKFKLLFVVSCIGLEVVFKFIVTLINKKKSKISQIIESSLLRSLVILLGFLLYNDFKYNPQLLSKVPGLSELIDNKIVQIVFYMTPTVLMTISSCLLRAY